MGRINEYSTLEHRGGSNDLLDHRQFFALLLVTLQERRDLLDRLFGCNHWMHLEIDEVAPVCHPRVEQQRVVCFHQLIATLKLVINPARDIDQALRRHPALVAKAPIDGHSIPLLKMLYHHVQRFGHPQPPSAPPPGGSVLSKDQNQRRLLTDS